MANSGRTVVAMLVGVALITLGCEDNELATLEPKPVQSQPTTPNSPQTSQPTVPPSSSASVLAWAEVLEQNPDPRVVTDADFLKRITETKLPWQVKDKASGIVMLLVPPGKFVMGMSPGDSQASPNERPAHEVTITEPFYLGRTEVTAEQWKKVMGESPSKTASLVDSFLSKGLTKQEAIEGLELWRREHPAQDKSWDDCRLFCVMVGLSLPTEAQWEYACRAGVRKPMYGELEQIAWLPDEDGETHSVAKKAPNALGFYDMLGNVAEYCGDWYDEPYYKSCQDGVVDPSGPTKPTSDRLRVYRGGPLLSTRSRGQDNSVTPEYQHKVRASYRDSCSTSGAYDLSGFRVARAANAWATPLHFLTGDEEATRERLRAQAMLEDGAVISSEREVRRQQAITEFKSDMNRSQSLLAQRLYDQADSAAVAARTRLDRARNVLSAADFDQMSADAKKLVGQIDRESRKDHESSATSTTAVDPKLWKNGRLVTAQGVELKPRKPQFTMPQQVSSLPNCRPPVVSLTFDGTGKCIDVFFNRSSGDSEIDGVLKNSLYVWRAAGKKIEDLKGSERVRITLQLLF
jgi:formylglycine-generating enzyme required for sulfatase activity